MTDEQKDSQERIEKFKDACVKASQEFECDLLAVPTFVPVQGGGFKTDASIQILDKRLLPMKSPFDPRET